MLVSVSDCQVWVYFDENKLISNFIKICSPGGIQSWGFHQVFKWEGGGGHDRRVDRKKRIYFEVNLYIV